MPNIADLLAGIDAVKRKGANTFRDLLVDPRAAVERILANMAEDLQSNVTFDPEGESVVPEVRDPARERNAQKMVNLGSLSGAIKAYHGSPYKFDKFDMKKLGTGEGAQVYGPGLYLAEHPETAQYYAEAMPNRQVGQPILDLVRDARERSYKTGTSAEEFLRARRAQTQSRYFKEQYTKALEELALQDTPGNLYTVNMRWKNPQVEAVDPLNKSHFLDLDSYLEAQKDTPVGKRFAGVLKKWGVEDATVEGAKGRWALNFLQDHARDLAGDAGIQTLIADLGRVLPGARYLDSGSRGKSLNGTSNFVAFKDNLLDIIRREEIPRW